MSEKRQSLNWYVFSYAWLSPYADPIPIPTLAIPEEKKYEKAWWTLELKWLTINYILFAALPQYFVHANMENNYLANP